MATEVKLPELGPGIEAGDILEVLVKEGDVISKGQDIVEIETDKATVPIPSNVGGKVVKVHVSKQQSVKVGGLLIEVESAESGSGSKPAAPQAAPPPAAAAPPPAAPSSPPPPPAEPPKAAPVPAAAAPAPTSPAPSAPAPAPATPAPAVASKPAVPQPVAATGAAVTGEVIPAGPAIRRLAREMGVDLQTVAGTGVSGRITRDDVLEYVRSTNQAARSSHATTTTAPAVATPTPSATPPRRLSLLEPAAATNTVRCVSIE